MNARSMLLVGLSGTAAAGAAYEAFAECRDARRFPPPGSRVPVDGRHMHLLVRGPASATGPTVVLDAGLGSQSATHESLVSRREHAAVVAAAIRAVVATGRGGRLAEHRAADTPVVGATGRP